jgi:hypothetical protein
MALQPPDAQSGVPRDEVPDKVSDMLLDDSVKWIAIVFEGAVGGVDTFKVTSYVNDPTKPS